MSHSWTVDPQECTQSLQASHLPAPEQEPLTASKNHWLEGTQEHEMEEARGPSPVGIVHVENAMIKDVSRLLSRLADKSDRLIGNFTTNLAEAWMNIRMKLDGGKVVNRCHRGSWHARCYGGALRMNFGKKA